jgi:hypothetical protein
MSVLSLGNLTIHNLAMVGDVSGVKALLDGVSETERATVRHTCCALFVAFLLIVEYYFRW